MNTQLNFETSLPTDILYCPTLGCEVYDQIFPPKWSQPKLGTFNIPVGKIMHNQFTERQRLLELSFKSITFLEEAFKNMKVGRSADEKIESVKDSNTQIVDVE